MRKSGVAAGVGYPSGGNEARFARRCTCARLGVIVCVGVSRGVMWRAPCADAGRTRGGARAGRAHGGGGVSADAQTRRRADAQTRRRAGVQACRRAGARARGCRGADGRQLRASLRVTDYHYSIIDPSPVHVLRPRSRRPSVAGGGEYSGVSRASHRLTAQLARLGKNTLYNTSYTRIYTLNTSKRFFRLVARCSCGAQHIDTYRASH